MAWRRPLSRVIKSRWGWVKLIAVAGRPGECNTSSPGPSLSSIALTLLTSATNLVAGVLGVQTAASISPLTIACQPYVCNLYSYSSEFPTTNTQKGAFPSPLIYSTDVDRTADAHSACGIICPRGVESTALSRPVAREN